MASLRLVAAIRYTFTTMKVRRAILTALLLLATSLGTGAPQASFAMSARPADGMPMAMPDMPEMAGMDLSGTRDCPLCDAGMAAFGCAVACLGLPFVMPTPTLAPAMRSEMPLVALADARLRGLAPRPDLHPPRPIILG